MKKKQILPVNFFSRWLSLFVTIIILMLPVLMNAQTRTSWEMHTGIGPEPYTPCPSPGHGDIGEYATASIPAVGDPGWGAAPNGTSIGFAGASELCGIYSCRCGVDFTYFQTLVTIPGNVTVTTFSLTFSGVDDGARVTIFNSLNPTGLVVAGSYVYLGGTTTADLAAYMVSGEVNRVAVTHVDDCCSWRSLNGNIVLNGVIINPSEAQIIAKKFYDTNADGIRQVGEPYLANWVMTLNPGNVIQNTDGTGSTTFGPLPGGNYILTEGALSGWLPTNPNSRNIAIILGNEIVTESFGNICLGGGGAYSKGYWGNKNGEATLNACSGGMPGALADLVALNLRNANGSHFDPATYTAYKNWNQASNATNMAYMLSAQMAAMKLNMRCAGVMGSIMIYAPGTASANGFGFASLSSVMTEANTLLAANGLILNSHSLRSQATALKNALDNGNNNLNFVQLTPCQYGAPPQRGHPGHEIVSDNQALSFQIWPNPSKEYFNLRLVESENNDKVEIRIYNVNGKQVYSREGADNLIYKFGEDLPSGMYIINISQGDKKTIQKLIKQ